MADNRELKLLFKEWNELNNQVGESFQDFDFSTLKEFREKKRDIEDSIYMILLDTAPSELKKILPNKCGEMELGYNKEKNKFYFLMEDPEQNEGEELTILAITINSDNNIETIKNFKSETE